MQVFFGVQIAHVFSQCVEVRDTDWILCPLQALLTTLVLSQRDKRAVGLQMARQGHHHIGKVGVDIIIIST